MIYGRINGNKLLAIFIPKTSGNSQERFFALHPDICESTKEDRVLHNKVKVGLNGMSGIKHPEHETLEMNLRFGGDEIKDYIPMITMREPLDWHLSWFHFYRGKNFEENRADLQGKSFVEYVRWLDDVHSGRVEPKRVAGRYHCLMRQSEWLWDGKRYRIENTLDFSNIGSDFTQYIEEHFDMPNVVLWHKNKTNYRNLDHDQHTEETRDIISRWYDKDINIYAAVQAYRKEWRHG